MSGLTRATRVSNVSTSFNPPSRKEETRKEFPMRSKLTLLATATALVFATHTATAQSSGGGMKSGALTATTTSVVTVTIPGVVGIDIESDVAIDLGSYLVASRATTGACPANVFPPPAGCTLAATYAATGTTTTATAPGPTPTAGNIWMAVFCTKSGGSMTIKASVDAAFAPSSPGFLPTALRNMASAANNVPVAGNATATNFLTAPTLIGNGSLLPTFGWTRVDQLIDLSIPAASAVTFTAGAFTATATFTIGKS
jgi:hypothetical protein